MVQKIQGSIAGLASWSLEKFLCQPISKWAPFSKAVEGEIWALHFIPGAPYTVGL